MTRGEGWASHIDGSCARPPGRGTHERGASRRLASAPVDANARARARRRLPGDEKEAAAFLTVQRLDHGCVGAQQAVRD